MREDFSVMSAPTLKQSASNGTIPTSPLSPLAPPFLLPPPLKWRPNEVRCLFTFIKILYFFAIMVVYCAVYGCASSSKNKQRLLYPFPKNEARCSAWIEAIDRPDLGHLTIQTLHEDYRVCDMHFVFLDHHKILLDDAVPSINLIDKSQFHMPNMALQMAEKSQFHSNSNVYQTQTNFDASSKSTQTDFSNVNESTQTMQTCLTTCETACQTDGEDGQDPQKWKVKRKLLITLAFDNKLPKMEKQSVDSDSDVPLDTLSSSNHKNSKVSVTCQPDISSMVSKNKSSKDKTVNMKSQKQSHKKTYKNKTAGEKKPRQKRKYTKSKIKKESIQSTESSTESEPDTDYDTLMITRLEEAIKLIQQQWKIHEKKYRKDNMDCKETVVNPLEKLQVKQGRSYGNELKFLALNLFYSNPTAYKALRQHLNLPTEKTLRRIEVGISTKLTPTVLKCLRLILSKLKEEEKFCVICTNMLPLKEEIHKIANSEKYLGHHEINEVQGPEPACKTLVVLIKGLYSDWKQPLITCYLKENFNQTEVITWLDEIIASLLEIGFKVVGFTTNEHPDLLSMAKERSISVERPFFFVNNHKIYYFFDILHIMISIRNLLLNNYFRYIDVDGSEQIASWFDIEKLYETDKTRVYKLAPKLTEKHIIPSDSEKNKIQFPVQVFSKTVAAGIISCIEQKHLTARSFGTVKFVELINNVFDILNSYDEKELCRFKNPFCFKDYQLDVLEKMLNVLSNLKIITKNYEDITASIESFKCLEITIRSVLSLASDQKTEGYEYLCTRNVSLETLNDFFESLRRKWGYKATAVLFYAGFRNYFLENVIKKSESNDSCGLDKDLISILLKDNSNTSDSTVSVGAKASTKDFNPFYKYL